MSFFIAHRARISRSMVTVFLIGILQLTNLANFDAAYGAAGNVGSTTASGTCSSGVGETTYVEATFVNNAFCLLKFTATTSWVAPTGVTTIDILVVGGGGGGGADGGGGGGGGEVRQATGISVTAGNSSSVTVGLGGNGQSHTPSSSGSQGGSSGIVINGTTYSAGGGVNGLGWQGSTTAQYAAAGSGGSNGTQITGGTNFSKGGRTAKNISGSGSMDSTSPGYAGVTTSFTGSSTDFAGGGGGGICTDTKSDPTFGGAAGGAGGGGRGALHTVNVGSDAGQAGTNGLGGGGGAGSACNDGGTDGTNARTRGGRGGDGVVYIKYVPIISLNSNPQSISVVLGTTATFTSSAFSTIAGATRTKKWQVLTPGGSWTDIASSSADSYVTASTTRSMHGNQYRFVATDTVGTMVSTTYSSAATLSVTAPSQGDSDTAMSRPIGGWSYGYTTAAGADAITPKSTDAFSVEAWIRPNSTCASDYCTIASREGAFLFQIYQGKIGLHYYNSGWSSWTPTTTSIPPEMWSHVALTRNGTTFKFFVNGTLVYTGTYTYTPTASSSYYFYAGVRPGPIQQFDGSIDELKLWKSDRSSQIATDMGYSATNSTNLVGYWNFNEASGSNAYNQVVGAAEGSDFTLYSNSLWNESLISTQTARGSYTIQTFKRSIITHNGGWKVPSNAGRVTAVLVGAGGGGGGGNNGGGGGAGGYVETTTSLAVGTYLPITVGAGGLGLISVSLAGSVPTNGGNSIAFGMTASGGGYGASEYSSPNTHYAASSGGSGGGGTWGNNSANYSGRAGTNGQGYAGGNSGVITNSYVGAGGGGAGGVGGDATAIGAGAGGVGKFSQVTNSYLAGGGGGGFRNSTAGGSGGTGGGGAGAKSTTAKVYEANGPQAGTENTGGGGGGAIYVSGDGQGANGGTGIVALRWITASKPAFTKPTNAYLNVGMTETFTTNVPVDSATVDLVRTFRWESTTPTSGGSYSVIKQGTGAANASFSWIPSDTSTSGSGYLYRVIVTDSDMAGLFIVDTSTPVFAVINRALVVSGTSRIAKTINVAKSETFTITLGTPTYRAALSPIIPGITVDTSTTGYAVLKVSETATVGTYSETLTITDSVSAVVTMPLTIKISAPPTLVNDGEIVSNGLVLHLDSANTASFNRGTNSWSDLSGSNRTISTNGGTGTFSDDYMGVVKQSPANNQAIYTSGIGKLETWSIDTWVRIDATLTEQRCVINSEYISSSINYFLCLDSGRTVFTGFYTGGQWTYMRTTYVVPTDTWVHLAGVWNGSTTKLFVNGVIAPGTEIANNAGVIAPAPDGSKTYIGKWWDTGFSTSASHYMPMTIGSIRLYNVALTDSQISSNYLSTKSRFDISNLTELKPTQKYGVLTLESFTATSGGDTKTVVFSASPRQGVVWDTTSTPGQIKLSVGESLSVGTYYETVTVTDNFGASTYLPLTFTVTKADTITVTSGSSLTTVYSGSAPTNGPVARITGLVGKDTATVLTRYETSTVGKTCATGGTCRIGDTGPGGGVVFYVSDTPINKAEGISEGGIYLEMHTTSINVNNWSSDPTSVPGTSAAIGTGAENTRRAFTQLGSNSSLMTTIANGTYGTKSDWFVPSLNEAMTMVSTLRNLGLGSFGNQNLWSSTEGANSANAEQVWSANPPVSGPLAKSGGYTVRPIRAFGGTTITPVDVDTYTAVGTNINFSIGALDNYQAVTYETSTLKITQANQNKLSINLYGAIAGTPFLIQTSGGSGTGAVTETVTAGGTATNCALSNHVLSNSSPNTVQVTCNIKVTKASSRNYFAESLDATVYFMLYVNNMPTNQVGSGSTIGLNGATSLTIDDSATVRAPLISSISISGTTVTINGEGFGSSAVSIKFERNIITSATPSGTDAAGIITVTLPGGARSGYVLVTLPSGAKATSPYLTLP